MTDESKLQVRPKDGDSALSLSTVRSGLIARGRRDAAILAEQEEQLAKRQRFLKRLQQSRQQWADRQRQTPPSASPALPPANRPATKLPGEGGDADARWDLAIAYLANDVSLSTFTPQDYAEALRCWRQAADAGDAGAQLVLGLFYSTGDDVLPKNEAEAAKWFRQAADAGDTEAAYLLGAAYRDGDGVPQDYVLAHVWLNLSASGDTVAGRRRAEARDDQIESQFNKIWQMLSKDPDAGLRDQFVEFVLHYEGGRPDEPSSTTRPAGNARSPRNPRGSATPTNSQGPSERKAAVDTFLRSCNQELPFKVKKKHIYAVAKHRTARQFQRWQAGDENATSQDEENFPRILSLPPQEFHAHLVRLKVEGVPPVNPH